MLNHPAVAEARETTSACPVQVEGRLVDGRHFYFRYRHGRATLGVGADFDAAVRDWNAVGRGLSVAVGGPMDGCFEDDEQREAVFAEVYAARMNAGAESVEQAPTPALTPSWLWKPPVDDSEDLRAAAAEAVRREGDRPIDPYLYMHPSRLADLAAADGADEPR